MITFFNTINETPAIEFEVWSLTEWIIYSLIALIGLTIFIYFDKVGEALFDLTFGSYEHPVMRILGGLGILTTLVLLFYAFILLPADIPRHMDAEFQWRAAAVSPYLIAGVLAAYRAIVHLDTHWGVGLAAFAIPTVLAAGGLANDAYTRVAASIPMSVAALTFVIIAGAAALLLWAKYSK